MLESEKLPDQNRIYYDYPGQAVEDYIFDKEGMTDKPVGVSQYLESGAGTKECQAQRFTHNDLGMITKRVEVTNCDSTMDTDDLEGRTTLYTYAANDIDLIKVEQELSAGGTEILAEMTYSSPSDHLPTSVTDPAGEVTDYEWNSKGQLTKVTNPSGEITNLSYDVDSRLEEISGDIPDGPYHIDYDGTVTYRVASITRSHGNSDAYKVDFEFDDLDRLTKVTYPDATYQSYTYTHLDITSRRDREGQVTDFEFDDIRRLVKVTNPELEETDFAWCGCGALSSLTDAENNVTTWERDVRGRVMRKVYDDGDDITYSYDSDSGRLASMTDARGITTSYTYNQEGSIASVAYSGSGAAVDTEHFEYHEDYPRLTRAWTGSTLLSASSRSDYEYYPISTSDPLGSGRLKSVDGSFISDKITYTYDEEGRVETRTTQGQGTETFGYDTKGRMTSVVNDLGSFAWVYNAATNRPDTLTYPNGMVLDYDYDNVNGDLRLNRLHYKDSTSATLADYEYTRRDDGHITSWSNSQTGDDWDLFYDGAGRLTEVKDSGVDQYRYTYDALGNKDEFILGTGTLYGDFNGLNQLTQMKDGSGTPIESFTYDDNGNLLTDGTNTYTWDLKDRLVEIDDGTHVTEIQYDAFDRWIQVTTTETSTSTVTVDQAFVWCGTTICQERDGASTGTVERELYGVGHQEGTTNRFYLRDHLGSVRGMVNDSEVVTSAFAYDPYGRMTTLSGTESPSYGYAQLWHHGQTDLNFAVWRAYNPEIGRWISRDPIGERGGINIYEYVLSSPTAWSDPLGLEVAGVYDTSTGSLTIWDVSTGETVTFDFFSGGKPIGDPIPAGSTFDILEHPDSGKYRLEALDQSYGDDRHNGSSRTHFRLHHPGRSTGCITAYNWDAWIIVEELIENAAPFDARIVDSASPYPWSPDLEIVNWYGTISTI